MLIFLFISMPLLTLLCLSQVSQDELSLRPTFRILGKSLLLFIAALVIYWSTRYALDFTRRFLGQWYYSMVHFGNLSFLGAYLLSMLFPLFEKEKKTVHTIREDILLWGGFFSFYQIAEGASLTGANHWGYVFLFPLIRASLLVVFLFLSQRQRQGSPSEKWINLAILLGVLLFTGFVKQLLFMHLLWLQLILTLIILGATSFFFMKNYSTQ